MNPRPPPDLESVAGFPPASGESPSATSAAAPQPPIQTTDERAEFLASLSHELRTPLHILQGLTRMARTRTNDPVVADLLGRSLSQASLLRAMIDDLLDLSLAHTGRLALRPSSVDLTDMVASVVNSVRPYALARDLWLDVELEDGLPERIEVDGARVRRILLAFLLNAIRFTDEGGVTLRVGSPPNEGGEPLLKFDVKDTGIGIHADQQALVFEPFIQVHRRLEDGVGGNGLGLPLCRRLARLMGGEIRLISAPGQGSTFSFVAPVQESEPLPALDKEGEARDPAPHARVLVVDDATDAAMYAQWVLEREGYLVDVASGGKEAIGLALHREYDLLLLDIEMPDIDGFEVARAVRAAAIRRQDGSPVAILALSAHLNEEFGLHGLIAGFDGWVTKPCPRRTLVESVRHALQGTSDSVKTQEEEESPPSSLAGLSEDVAGSWASRHHTGLEVMIDDDLAPLVAKFLAIRKEEAEALRGPVSERRKQVVTAWAHRVKGSGSSYGFPRVTQLAADIEASCRGGDWAAVERALDDLRSYLADVRWVTASGQRGPS